jgi:twitching motility two-component system response regulator PilH
MIMLPVIQIIEAISMAVLLVVEDEKRIRQFVTINLRARGHEIMEAESAEIGLDLLRERPADALLLDIKLPGMNGWEMLQAIQNDKTLPQIPVILMSASSFSDPSEYSSYPHIAARLVKPLGVPTLLQTVSQLLSTYKATS